MTSIAVSERAHHPDVFAFYRQHHRLPRVDESPAPGTYRGWLLPYFILLHRRDHGVSSASESVPCIACHMTRAAAIIVRAATVIWILAATV